MSIDLEEVRRMARLARLELSEEELRHHAVRLARVLDHVRQLGSPEPPSDPGVPLPAGGCPLRPDRPGPSLEAATLLGQAPHQARGWFAVPLNLPDTQRTEDS